MDHFTRTRVTRLVQVSLILIISLLLILTRRDIDNLKADLVSLEKSGAGNRIHTRNTISLFVNAENPNDWKSLCSRLKDKPRNLSDLPDNYADLKMCIVFLQMSSEELVASIWEIPELDLPMETKALLHKRATDVLQTYYPDSLVKNFWGKSMESYSYTNVPNAFKAWLNQDPQAATAWYDQVGKTTPLSSEEMNRLEKSVNRKLFESDPDELRKRLVALPPQARFEALPDLTSFLSPDVASNYLTMVNELGLSSEQINSVKRSAMESALSRSQEDFEEMMNHVQMDTELLNQITGDYVNQSVGFYLMEGGYDPDELLQMCEWAESIAPGSGTLDVEQHTDDMINHTDSSDIDDAIERVLELQSLITGVDLIKPLIDSLDKKSMHDKAEALKSRLNYREEVRGDEK